MPLQTTEPTAIRCLVLRGLPILLRDDPSNFFKSTSVSMEMVLLLLSVLFCTNKKILDQDVQLSLLRLYEYTIDITLTLVFCVLISMRKKQFEPKITLNLINYICQQPSQSTTSTSLSWKQRGSWKHFNEGGRAFGSQSCIGCVVLVSLLIKVHP